MNPWSPAHDLKQEGWVKQLSLICSQEAISDEVPYKRKDDMAFKGMSIWWLSTILNPKCNPSRHNNKYRRRGLFQSLLFWGNEFISYSHGFRFFITDPHMHTCIYIYIRTSHPSFSTRRRMKKGNHDSWISPKLKILHFWYIIPRKNLFFIEFNGIENIGMFWICEKD